MKHHRSQSGWYFTFLNFKIDYEKRAVCTCEFLKRNTLHADTSSIHMNDLRSGLNEIQLVYVWCHACEPGKDELLQLGLGVSFSLEWSSSIWVRVTQKGNWCSNCYLVWSIADVFFYLLWCETGSCSSGITGVSGFTLLKLVRKWTWWKDQDPGNNWLRWVSTAQTISNKEICYPG